MIATAAKLYRTLIVFGLYLAPIALLLLRLGWGWELIESGYRHLSDIPKTVELFRGFGITWQTKANVIVAGSTELVGGVCWMLGLAARAISLPLIFNFGVAYLTASKDNVHNFFHQDPSNIIDDTAYPFLITSLIILAVGPGIISVDHLLKKTAFKKYAAGL